MQIKINFFSKIHKDFEVIEIVNISGIQFHHFLYFKFKKYKFGKNLDTKIDEKRD